MKIALPFISLMTLLNWHCHQVTCQESSDLPRRSDCIGEIVYDVETTSWTKLIDPTDSVNVHRMERMELQPDIEREEGYLCVRADSTFRMENRIKVPSDSTLLEYWSPKQLVPGAVLTVGESYWTISYDEDGKSIDTFHYDQTGFNEMKYLQMQDMREGGPLRIYTYLDSIVQRGGAVEYLTPRRAKATYKGTLGGIITEFIDLDLGVFTETTIHDTTGKLTRRTVFRFVKGNDGKIRPLHKFSLSWSTLRRSGVRIVKEKTQAFHSYDYHFSH